jgi:hypothetical protein
MSRNYVFTLHFANEDAAIAAADEFEHSLPDDVKFLTFQVERAPTTGSIHWQGYIELAKTMRMTAVHNTHPLFETMSLRERRGTQQQAIDYCHKEETRVAGPFTFGEPARQGKKRGPTFDDAVMAIKENPNLPMSHFEDKFPAVCARNYSALRDYRLRCLQRRPDDSAFVPRPWQAHVLKMLDKPADDRHIIWVTDTAGNNGKSRLSKYLQCQRNATVLSGRTIDMAHCFKNNVSSIAIFDISRAAAEYSDNMYTMGEKLKDGSFNSSKYDSAPVFITELPHVLFFSNSTWDRSKWTNDRVIEIDLSCPNWHIMPAAEPEPKNLEAPSVQEMEDLFQTIGDMPLDHFW